MTDAERHEDSGEPTKRGAPTIAEESRQRWMPDHADVKEAGDDGPHRTEAEDGTADTGDSARSVERQPEER